MFQRPTFSFVTGFVQILKMVFSAMGTSRGNFWGQISRGRMPDIGDHQPMICHHHQVPETSDLQNRLLQMVQNKLIYFPTRTTQLCLVPICHLRRDAAELDVSFLLIWSLKKLVFLGDGDKASSHDSMTVQFSCHDDNSKHALSTYSRPYAVFNSFLVRIHCILTTTLCFVLSPIFHRR